MMNLSFAPKMVRKSLFSALVLGILASGAASAATVTLPDSSQSSMLTATVSEQATITVPASISFNVTNIGASTASAPVAIDVTNIVMSTAADVLRISIYGAAATFTSPDATPSWAVGDVSWSAGTWTAGAGTLGLALPLVGAPAVLANCTAAATACSSSGATGPVFTLAPKTTVVRSGNHTLLMSYKLESI